MIGGLQRALARRAVRAAIARRQPGALGGDVRRRRLLIVLPHDARAQRAAWTFVDGLDLPPGQITVVAGTSLESEPDAFVGAVQVLGEDALDWRRLPTAAALRRAWDPVPDVAIDLVEPDDDVAALLVGASPAAVRVGLAPDRERAFDLLVQGGPDGTAVDALGRLLRQIDPPLLPTR